MSIQQWHNRLHQHFTALAIQRSAVGKTLFVLEHGLSQQEIQTLENEIRLSLGVAPPSDAYWLPWIVYATEVGYKYDGEEYWQTFEQNTPGWVTCRSKPREWLRDRFIRFQKTYKGIRPSGRWAEFFSIIAWPIQNAILPGFLQYHLAKLLFELRFDLNARLLADPTALGHYIHAESTRSVKRLQEFAEEHLLVGTIATALLLSGEEFNSLSVLPTTLQRLISDLESEQRARNWLRGAQDQARRVSLRGVARAVSSPKPEPSVMATPISKKEIPEIEPRISLVPEGDAWRVFLETPDLSPLLSRFPRFRDVLSTSRCAVGGASGKFQSRGWLLYGPHRVPLSAWPKPGEVLLWLETRDVQLDALMKTDFLIRPGPMWLFRVGTDGIAREVKGFAVRPGQSYVVVKASGELPIRAPAISAKLLCSGVQALRINLLPRIDEATASYLERLGLNAWQTVRIQPVGLPPAIWDGEGWAEWLIGDDIHLGISSDHPVARIDVSLDNGPLSHLDLRVSAQPILVALPPMAVGLHRLKVVVQNRGPNPADQSGQLEFLIRSPKARLDAYKALFRISTDPERASMDDLWRGRVIVELHGPRGRTATPIIELVGEKGGVPLARKVLTPLTMPTRPESWQSTFQDQCVGDPALEDRFDEASLCKLRFDAGDLGTTDLLFEHVRKPLRWVINRSRSGVQLRLINEAVDSDAVSVDYYPYETPDRAKRFPAGDFDKTTDVSPQSGLFVAVFDKIRSGILSPPTIAKSGFAALGLRPHLSQSRPTPDALLKLADLYDLWTTSRVLHDPLSCSFRRRVLARVESEIFDLLYGETKLLGGDLGGLVGQARASALQRLLRSISEIGIRTNLAVVGEELLELPTNSRPEIFARRILPLIFYRGVVPSPGPSTSGPSWIAEFALRLASAPDTISSWAATSSFKAIEFLLKQTTIVKAARFIVLSGESSFKPQRLTAGPIHEQWGWE